MKNYSDSILFLDDDINRTRLFKGSYPNATCVDNAESCISNLTPDKRYDILFLDHDLGGETYVDSEIENCGMEVVRFLFHNKRNVGQVIVHSLNADAAIRMVSHLINAGYCAFYVPFTSFRKHGVF